MDLNSLENLGNFTAEPQQAEAAKGIPLEIPLHKIIPGANPRRKFDPDYLARLAASIKARGVKSPISVKLASEEEVAASFAARELAKPAELDGFYKINHGECRFRSSGLAGKETIPAFLDDDHNGIDALAENIQRKNLDPIDIAKGIEEKVHEGMKKGDIARELGVSASYVSNHLRLLDLPASVEAMVLEGKTHDVTALLQLASAYKDYPKEIDAFCAAAEEPTQSQVRQYIAGLKAPLDTTGDGSSVSAGDKGKETAAAKKKVDPNIAALETELSEKLGAKVGITMHGGSGGTLSIRFFSTDELEGVLERLR